MARDSEARKHYIDILDRHGSLGERREDAMRARRSFGFSPPERPQMWGPQGVPSDYFDWEWWSDD